MAYKIASLKNKGGVASSTIISNIAGALSQKNNSKGKPNRILLIDTDGQSTLKTLYAVKTGADGGFASVITEGISPKALTIKVRDNIDLLPSGGRLVREIENTFSHTPNAEMLMRARFSEIEDSYDYILVDSNPAISLITNMILNYSDYVITATSLDLLGLVGVKNMLQFHSLTKKHYPKIGQYLAIIPSLVDFRRRIDLDLHQDLLSLQENGLTEGAIVTTPFRNDSKVRTSQVRRKTVLEAFPDAKASLDIIAITEEIVAEIQRREKPATKPKQTRKQEPEAGI